MDKARESEEVTVEQCAQALIQAGLAREERPRFLLGITGIPGAGKSTFAALLAATLNRLVRKEVAVVIPMDGFHFPNVVLEERGLQAVKGAPETFDVQGFVELLGRLREDPAETIWCPRYDRELHDRVNNALAVTPSIRIVLVEGNYLLLTTPPWDQVRGQLDQVWYLDIPYEITAKRLMQRHVAGGRTEEDARAKIAGTDQPNTDLVEATRGRADRIVRLAVET
jgi:pantothenate kinase